VQVALAPEQQKVRQIEVLESALERERRDHAWSSETEERVEGFFATNGAPRTALVAAPCASSLCRVVVRHDDAESQRALAAAVNPVPPFDYAVY
jgi:hypothetical protein